VTHLDRETLAAYFCDPPTTDAEAVEEHLFACDACARAAERMAFIVRSLGRMIPPVVSPDTVRGLEQEGRRLRRTEIHPGQRVVVEFSRDVDLLIHVLRGDLASARRIDLEIEAMSGEGRQVLPSVPFDAATGTVLIACQRHYQEAYPPELRFRLVASEPAGRRVVGEYVIDHVWPEAT
jgi:hypothetical protein